MAQAATMAVLLLRSTNNLNQALARVRPAWLHQTLLYCCSFPVPVDRGAPLKPLRVDSFNICCPRDCVSRHNGGTSGTPA